MQLDLSIFFYVFRRYFISITLLILLLIGIVPRATATQWVPVEGQVMFDGAPLCAMVLANGQNMFSCNGDGRYQLSAPVDNKGQITLLSFASGFASFKRILTVEEAQNFVIIMERETDGHTLTGAKLCIRAV